MPRYGMIIDITRCNGCYNCQIACKDEHVGNRFPPYSESQPLSGHFWMRIEEKERGQYPRVLMAYVPVPCVHCQRETPCMAADKTGAIYRRSDGIILINPEKARDQKELTDSCPFGAIFWNETVRLPQKCTFCAHLLDSGWKEPRCVEACPTEAILFGDLDDPQSRVSIKRAEHKTEAFQGRQDLEPGVLHVGIPKPFLNATVILADIDECARGARVTLTDEIEGSRMETRTDRFGDFQFDGLTPDHSYSLSVIMEGYIPQSIPVHVEQDMSLKEIILEKSG